MQLKTLFPFVVCAKPKSSRNSSIESFVVCQNYTPPPGFNPSHLRSLLAGSCEEYSLKGETLETRKLVPFLACGDLSGWDADKNYDLEEGKEILDPVQPPTEPAYKEAIERTKRKAGTLM